MNEIHFVPKFAPKDNDFFTRLLAAHRFGARMYVESVPERTKSSDHWKKVRGFKVDEKR